MVKFFETRFVQSELMVYKNFEKNYKTYRKTWSGEAIIVEPEFDARAIAALVVDATLAKAAAA